VVLRWGDGNFIIRTPTGRWDVVRLESVPFMSKQNLSDGVDTTETFEYSVTATELAALLDALNSDAGAYSGGASTVTGDNVEGFKCTLGGSPTALLSPSAVLGDGVITASHWSGFTLGDGTETTSQLQWESLTAAALQTALNALNSGAGPYSDTVTVTGDNSTGFVVTWDSNGAHADLTATTVEGGDVTVTETTPGDGATPEAQTLTATNETYQFLYFAPYAVVDILTNDGTCIYYLGETKLEIVN
jgi:hypothetical protein